MAPSWPILGKTCCQLGPSCVHLGPIFVPTSPKISTKSSRSAPRHPKTTQGVARGLQYSPWSINFNGFGIDFGLHLDLFQRISRNLRPHVESSFKAAGLARWRLCARSALDIRRPPEGCRACVDLVLDSVRFRQILSNSSPGGPPRAIRWQWQPAPRAGFNQFFDLSWPS